LIAELEENRPLRFATLGLMAFATAIVQLAIADPGEPMARTLVFTTIVFLAPAVAASLYLGRRADVRRAARSSARWAGVGAAIVLSLLAIFAMPFAIQFGRVAWLGHGMPLELVLLTALRNLCLGLGVLSFLKVGSRLAAIVSLFLVSVGSALGEGQVIIVLVGVYAVVGTLWLMLGYWGRLRIHSDTKERRLPSTTIAWVLGVIGLVCAAAVVGPTRAATFLAGLVPSSGGTQWDDPDARSGVNDGENEVSGTERPESIGFTESEIYLETDRPSLYDAVNEQFGEPLKIKKMERMIAVGVQKDIEQKQRPSENLQAGRQFAMTREKPQRPATRPSDRAAKALVYVKGPAPLHLRLATYDRFDGETWFEEECTHPVRPFEQESDRTWFRMISGVHSCLTSEEAHQIKIGTLDSRAIPTPTNLARFRVGGVNQPAFFGMSLGGVLQMQERTVPAGTVIELESRLASPRRLREMEYRAKSDFPNQRYATFAEGYQVPAGVLDLADRWTQGVPRGWGQVEAVVASLRRDYIFDRDSVIPVEHGDVVEHFLTHSKHGPDSEFAAAAVMLLRCLGYQARLVSGLYASTKRYDARTRHTPVLKDDVHFWAEVATPGGVWIPIEPTPGYELREASPSLPEQLMAALTLILRRARENTLGLALSAVGLLAAYGFRLAALDALTTLAWWLAPRRSTRRLVLRTLRLVENRSRWAGRPRPSGQTPARWYGSMISATAAEEKQDLHRLVRLADRTLYAAPDCADLAKPLESAFVLETCRRAVRAWTLGRFRSIARSCPREAVPL
jgi:hypothetical protein